MPAYRIRRNPQSISNHYVSKGPSIPDVTWAGKYGPNGRREPPFRIALPFQTVETVKESAEERQRAFQFTADVDGKWKSRLVWGHKKYVLPALVDELAGQVDLIHVDPPFVGPLRTAG